MKKETYFRERSNGRWNYFTYVDGRVIHNIKESWVLKQVRLGRAVLYDC